MTNLTRHTHWHNSDMVFMDVTNDFLIEFKAYFTRNLYLKTLSRSRICDVTVIDPKRDPITVNIDGNSHH